MTPGETTQQTGMRELEEETGFKVSGFGIDGKLTDKVCNGVCALLQHFTVQCANKSMQMLRY